METSFLRIIHLPLFGLSKKSSTGCPEEDTRKHPFSYSNTIGMTTLLNRQRAREIWGGGVDQRIDLLNGLLHPPFFNPFDQVDMGMKMRYQATSDGGLAKELHQKDFKFSQGF